jgi:hypothetical protein
MIGAAMAAAGGSVSSAASSSWQNRIGDARQLVLASNGSANAAGPNRAAEVGLDKEKLLQLGLERCPNVWENDPVKYPTIKSRFGYDLSDQQLKLVCDTLYTKPCEHLPYVSVEGNWTTVRDPANELRGFEGSVVERSDSVWENGILDLRKQAFLKERPRGLVNLPHVRASVLHWATLLQALEKCWIKDTHKTNFRVQNSLAECLVDPLMVVEMAPLDVDQFYVEYGNLVNSSVTEVTFLQALKSAKSVDDAFKRRRSLNSWTVLTLGQSLYDQKKFELANELYSGRWSKFRYLEMTTYVYFNTTSEHPPVFTDLSYASF